MSQTCAVIVNWNTWADTLECLESLLALAQRPDTVIVVDNGSDDDSVERILAFARARYPSVALAGAADTPPASPVPGGLPGFVLLRLPENLGCGQGNNAGLAYALARGEHTFFWVLNSDVAVGPDCLARLLEEARKRPRTGVFGASILKWTRGPESTGSAGELECAGGCRYLPWATMTLPAYAGLSLEAARRKPEPRLEYILGASFFLRREVLERVGLFSTENFLYYEEADFCLRAARQGFGLAWCREAVVHHKGGRSLAKACPDPHRRKLVANYHENLGALRFTRKHHPGVLPVAFVFRFLGKLAVLLARRELALTWALFWAYRDFLLGRQTAFPGLEPCPGSRRGSSGGL